MPAKKSGAARPGISPLGALRRVDESKWAREVRRAMKAADGHVPIAAEALGIAPRTLFLWLEDPMLSDIARAPMGPPRKDGH